MSEHNYTRILSDGQWNLEAPGVLKKARAAYPDTVFHVHAKGAELKVTATPGLTDATLLDELVGAQVAAFDPMPAIRVRLIEGIDAHTRQLIAQGFEYPAESGQVFSLSTAAQANLTAMGAANPGGLVPVPVPFKDDTGQIILADAAEFAAWGSTGAARVLSVRVAGSALKATVRGYGTPVEAAAFADGRT